MFKGQFHPACLWNKTLQEFAFQQNITFQWLFMNLCPIGAPISHFLAWMHNHFCVKLSSLSCNRQKKMPVEKCFISSFLPQLLLRNGVLVSFGDFLEWGFMHYIFDYTQDNRNQKRTFTESHSIIKEITVRQSYPLCDSQCFPLLLEVMTAGESWRPAPSQKELISRISPVSAATK